MNPIKKLLGQTAIYGLSSIVGRFLNYLMVPILTRVFTTSDYGDVVYWYSMVSFFSILLTYGMETAYFKFSQQNEYSKSLYSTTISALLFTSSLFLVIVFMFSQSISNLLGYPNHTEYLIWFSIILAVDAFVSIPFAKLRQQNKGVKFASLKLANIFINILVLLFFVKLLPWWIHLFPDSIFQHIYSSKIGVGYVFIANMIASIATLIMLLPEIKISFLNIDRKLLKQMLIYAFPLLFAGLAGMVNETLDRIILVKLIQVPEGIVNADKYIMSQIGIYGANYKLAILMTLFIQTFRYAAEPFFFSYAKNDDSKRVYADVTKYFLIFGLIIFLGVTLYIDFAKYFIGKKFYEGLKVVPILLMANLFLGIVYNLSIWYKLINMTKYGAYISIFGATITIVLNVLLIPFFGYMGAAWATFICYGSMMVYSYYLGNKYYPVKYNLARFLKYFSLALFIFFIAKIMALENIFIKTTVHTLLFMSFIGYAIHREDFINPIKKKIYSYLK